MQKRLCGREQEFGLVISGKRWSVFNEENKKLDFIYSMLKIIPKVVPALNRGWENWLKNGARIYEDTKILEAATAECLAGSLDLIAQEKALERILNHARHRVIRGRCVPGLKQANLYKNTISLAFPELESRQTEDRIVFRLASYFPRKRINLMKEDSHGCHHNYSYCGSKKEKVFKFFQNFIPISLPLTGCGHILRPVGAKCLFGFSQRALHIKFAMGSTTQIDRGLIDRRDENLAQKESGLNRLHLNRLHLISRDATRCEFQIWLVDAITHLVLRLAEERWRFPDKWCLKGPIQTLHQVNRYPDLDCRVFTYSGPVSLLDFNLLFLNAAKQLSPLSLMEKKALEEWSRVLELLKAGAWKKLVGELDWATKRFLLETKMKEQGFDINSVEAWLLCQEYHNISTNPKESWFARMDEAGLIKHMVTEEQIQRAIAKPPETRAKIRSKFIESCLENPHLRKKIEQLHWDEVAFQEEYRLEPVIFGKKHYPFSATHGDLEKLIKQIEK